MKKILVVLISLVLLGCNGIVGPKDIEESDKICSEHKGIRLIWGFYLDKHRIEGECVDGYIFSVQPLENQGRIEIK